MIYGSFENSDNPPAQVSGWMTYFGGGELQPAVTFVLTWIIQQWHDKSIDMGNVADCKAAGEDYYRVARPEQTREDSGGGN